MKLQILLFLFFCWPLILSAQQETLSNAIKYYTEGKLTEAKAETDKAILDPALAKDPKTWYTRAYVCKDLYKADPESVHSLDWRLESVKAFKKLKELDTQQEHKADRLKVLNYLAATFYNDALYYIEEKDFKSAVVYLDHHKSTAVFAEWTDAAIKEKEIEFYLNLAEAYRGLYHKDKSKKDYAEMIGQTYAKVLEMDKTNFEANYNMGIFYYNQAVDLVKPMDYDITIEGMMEIQGQTMVLFEKSLPYMQAAYNLDPQNKNTIVGLSGIYFGLNEFDKSDTFMKKLKELDKK